MARTRKPKTVEEAEAKIFALDRSVERFEAGILFLTEIVEYSRRLLRESEALLAAYCVQREQVVAHNDVINARLSEPLGVLSECYRQQSEHPILAFFSTSLASQKETCEQHVLALNGQLQEIPPPPPAVVSSHLERVTRLVRDYQYKSKPVPKELEREWAIIGKIEYDVSHARRTGSSGEHLTHLSGDISASDIAAYEAQAEHCRENITETREEQQRVRQIAEQLRELQRKKLAQKHTTEAAAAAHFQATRDLAKKIKTKLQSQAKITPMCPYCGGSLGDVPHADHIYPVIRGGLSMPDNMVYVCANCNNKKSDQTLQEFLLSEGLNRGEVETRLAKLGKRF